MDPHPTPFRAKRKSVAAPAKTPAPKPKSVATARGKMTTSATTSAVSPGAAPQPRPRRAFGTVRSSNSLAEKPAPPPPQKHSKLSPPPPQKPLKVSPPKLQKPAAKVSPPPPQKPAKVSPPPQQKPSKLSPPIPAKAARPSRPAEKPLKKACPAPPDLAAKAKKKSQRVSFQDDVAAVAASGSGEKVKASTEDSAGRTPMVPVKALEKKPAKVVVAETPFFSAQNCSSCTLDQLESASYWLAQIHLAESVGKHNVSAAFFRLAFECQAQPFHRIRSELRNYVVRHESASTLTPLFHELLVAHAMAANQLKFDTDGSEKVDTPATTNTVDQKLDATTLVHECSERDCGGDLVDVGEVSVIKQGEEEMDQPSFEQKLDESFAFDDCEAVIVDRLAEEHSEFEKIIGVKGPCDSEIVQSACRSSIDRLSLRGSPLARGASERRLSSESHLDKLSPSAGSLSAKRLSSSGSPFNNSPFCRGSLQRLTSSCPSSKKSSAKGGLSSKRMSSGACSDGEPIDTAGAGDSSRVIQEGEAGCHATVEPMKLKEHGEYDDAATDETQ
ncbi:reticulon-4-like isoform X2 [Triticum dicoccoides]|uniref:reticulon-4-like isoform X2 n=1 Tax=Triticum dicoccoides TaxID=85692 RepID=UPI0018907BCD|nr:reticulon-4-like isoform X2 [Triticum dicoccoides]